MESALAEPLLSDSPNDTDTTDHQRASQDPDQQAEHRQPSKMSAYFVFTVFVVCLPMFLFGYNTGVLNAPEAVIFPSHSVLQWSVAVSAFCAGGFGGANVSGRAADRFGRRMCLTAILFGNLVFGVIHFVAPNMNVLILARFGVGLAGGSSTVLTPMMLSEISPKEIRGSVGTLTQLSCVLGILASVLWALPFCTDHMWRLIFLPIPLISILGLLATPYCLPESPKWLLLNHYESRGHEAKNTMRLFRKFSNATDEEDEIEMEVLLLLGEQEAPLTALEQEEHEDGEENDVSPDLAMFSHIPSASVDGGTNEQGGFNSRDFRSYCIDPRNRVALASSILFPVAQQLSGINAVFYYSTSFFAGVIPNPQTGTIIAFSINVLATLVALALMDKLGRKTLLSWSAGGMFVCCILLTFALKGTLPGYVTVVAVMLYISFFEMGLGCIPFFLASEMIAPEHLGTVQSISMSANWFSNFCVGILFPYMDEYLGAYSFVPFTVVLFGTVLYSIFILPETSGKTLHEVMRELEGRQRVASSEPPSDQGPVAQSRERSSIEAETMLV